MKTGTSDPEISAVRSAFSVACSRPTLPAIVVSARTLTSLAESAIMIATASSEAVSVSMRKLRIVSGGCLYWVHARRETTLRGADVDVEVVAPVDSSSQIKSCVLLLLFWKKCGHRSSEEN